MEGNGGDEESKSPLSEWSVRREVSLALARLVRREDLRGSAVLFECCLWVQEGGAEGSLRSVLEGLVAKRQQKRQLQLPPPPPPTPQCDSIQERTCSTEESSGTNSGSGSGSGSGKPKQQKAPSSSVTSSGASGTSTSTSTSTSRYRPPRAPMSKRDCARLSETLLQAWKQKTGASGGTTGTDTGREKGKKGAGAAGAAGAGGGQAEYQRFQQGRKRLPAAAFEATLLAAIAEHQVVLVSGETG